jgi:hypothetical protein
MFIVFYVIFGFFFTFETINNHKYFKDKTYKIVDSWF